MDALTTTSTRPYLLRALYEWCSDNGLTPYVSVQVDETVTVPMDLVKNGEIVLNIGMDATSGLKLDNTFIAFKARFSGVARDIFVPMNRVLAIYARENGQGMAFPRDAADVQQNETSQRETDMPSKPVRNDPPALQLASPAHTEDSHEPEPPRPDPGARPALKRVK
jgi:stringent starvation protein B